MTQQRPWVTVAGASLTAKRAQRRPRQWITARQHADVQRLRAHCAVLTGAGTVMADNPRPTVRDFAVEQSRAWWPKGDVGIGALERAVVSRRTVVASALAHPGQRRCKPVA